MLPETRPAPALRQGSTDGSREPDAGPLDTTVQARVSAVHAQNGAGHSPCAPRPGDVASVCIAGQNRWVFLERGHCTLVRLAKRQGRREWCNGPAPNIPNQTLSSMLAWSRDENSPSTFPPIRHAAMNPSLTCSLALTSSPASGRGGERSCARRMRARA